MADDDERFQLAANAARRLTSQCLAHAQRVSSRMGDRVANAVPTSPCGVDAGRAAQGEHLEAFSQILEHVEATTNALVSHLAALKLLLDDSTFHPLPAMAISRSIAEVAASCVWMIRPGLSPDERAARGYAALFSTIQHGIANVDSDLAVRSRQLREELIQHLDQADVRVIRVVKDGIALEDVAQVDIGRSRPRARAKVRFRYSGRVKEEIPGVSPLYSAMSGAVHGARLSIATSWDTPDVYARTIGHVTAVSTEAWSRAVHEWLGATAGPFLNQNDRINILRSIPPATYAKLEAKLQTEVRSDPAS